MPPSKSSSSFAFALPTALVVVSGSRTSATTISRAKGINIINIRRARVHWKCATGSTPNGTSGGVGDDKLDNKNGDDATAMRRVQLESVYEASPSTWPMHDITTTDITSSVPLPPEDSSISQAPTLGEIKDSGIARIKQEGQDLKVSLSEVQARMETFADEETQKVLGEYEAQREALLRSQADRVELIRGDVQRVKELAQSLQDSSQYESNSRSFNLLTGLVAVFTVAALSFFVSAVVDENAFQLRYAVADMFIALAIAAYARSRKDDA